VQTPYGDSGKTTFFIAGGRDWDRHAKDLVDHDLKVMRKIRNLEIAVEASITRHGTIVGPFMTSLIGHPELTPYRAAGAATTSSRTLCRRSDAVQAPR
jgi:hypothetical protein